MIPIAALLAALFAPAVPAAAQEFVFRNVNVVPMDLEVVIPRQTVVVANGWIVAIGDTRDVAIPAGAQMIEGAGLYLMPGLADMHVHLPSKEYEGYGTEEFLMLQVASGVTTVRVMRGAKEHLEVRRRVETGDLIGPRLYISAPPITSSTVLEDATQLIAGWQEAGFDLIKILAVPDVETYDAICLAAQAANMRVAGHVPKIVGLERALELGQDSIEHLQGLYEISQVAPLEARKWVAEVAQREVAVCPTLDWYQVTGMQLSLIQLRSRPGIEYLPSDLVAGWIQGFERDVAQRGLRPASDVAKGDAEEKRAFEDRLALVKALDEAGTLLLLSPDATGSFGVPGFGLQRELELFAAAGLSPYASLQAATSNAGSHLGGAWGIVRAGKRADLLLLAANPLETVDNVRRIEGVMLDGKWLPKEWIAAQLEQLRLTVK